jgi:NAD-dependent deacetylase
MKKRADMAGVIPAEAVEKLREAQRLVVLTGAGVSAQSGVPTFRGKDGLWKDHRPEQLATPQAFEKDPDLVWDWYHWRRNIVREVSPNPAHYAIAQLEKAVPDFTLITQNVDGLHLVAGSERVLQIHGDLHHARCSKCAAVIALSNEVGLVNCQLCRGQMRPNVVWFGESLDAELLEEAFVASGMADFLIVAGTSNVVQPAASLAYAALGNGGYVLEVNLDPTPLTGSASATVLGKAGEVLEELVRLAWPED